MPRFQYAGLELISQFILSERLGPSPGGVIWLCLFIIHTFDFCYVFAIPKADPKVDIKF